MLPAAVEHLLCARHGTDGTSPDLVPALKPRAFSLGHGLCPHDGRSHSSKHSLVVARKQGGWVKALICPQEGECGQRGFPTELSVLTAFLAITVSASQTADK